MASAVEEAKVRVSTKAAAAIPTPPHCTTVGAAFRAARRTDRSSSSSSRTSRSRSSSSRSSSSSISSHISSYGPKQSRALGHKNLAPQADQ